MLWNIPVFVLVLIYVVAMFKALAENEDQPVPRWRIPQRLKQLHLSRFVDGPEVLALAMIPLGIGIAIGGYLVVHDKLAFTSIVKDFYANSAMECLSIAVTVLVIERLYKIRSNIVAEREEKTRLILQMGSPANSFALEAVRQLRQRGWLEDGSLEGADLYRTDLTQADLRKANLIRADLSYAILTDSKLAWSKLGGADLTNAKLVNVNLLDVDLSEAHLQRADLTSAFMCNTNLNQANLIEAILCDANISDARNLRNAALIDATYNSGTIWPPGFDPDITGAIEVEWNDESKQWVRVQN